MYTSDNHRLQYKFFEIVQRKYPSNDKKKKKNVKKNH